MRDATFKRLLKLVYEWEITRNFSYIWCHLSYHIPNSDSIYMPLNEAIVNVSFHMQKKQKSGLLAFPNDVIKWKHFPGYWAFVWGIHRSPVNSHTKASCAELWFFFE